MVHALLGVLLTWLACLSTFALQPDPASANERTSIFDLAGRWAGQGTMVPASGPSESFKCIITYFPSDDGTHVRQNLRCKGTTTKFDAATILHIANGQVTGQWQDNVYSLYGTVSGTVTEGGFDILLKGQFFDAKMTVVSSRCEQSVTVVPARADYMRELAAVLRKC